MTLKETTKIVYVIKATYPAHFAKYTKKEYDNMIQAWTAVMEDYTYMQASAGLKIYLASDTKGFPPSPGQVIDCITKTMKQPELEMNALEAWSLVRTALRNSGYGSQEEFAKLPKTVQKAVGSPENLREMSQLDVDQVETVEQSHFIKAYNAALMQERDDAKIPPATKRLIETVREKTRMLEGTQREDSRWTNT